MTDNPDVYSAIMLVREAFDKIQAFASLDPPYKASGPHSDWAKLIDASVALTKAMALMAKEDEPEPPAKGVEIRSLVKREGEAAK